MAHRQPHKPNVPDKVCMSRSLLKKLLGESKFAHSCRMYLLCTVDVNNQQSTHTDEIQVADVRVVSSEKLLSNKMNLSKLVLPTNNRLITVPHNNNNNNI